MISILRSRYRGAGHLFAAQALTLFIVACATASDSAAPSPKISISTESALDTWSIPEAEVIELLVEAGEAGQREDLHECVDQTPESVSATFFRQYELSNAGSDEDVLLIRPASQPYCGAYYGAHLFQFWIVSRARQGTSRPYRIELHSVADFLHVLTTGDPDRPDLVFDNCTGHGCISTRMRFDRGEYRVVHPNAPD